MKAQKQKTGDPKVAGLRAPVMPAKKYRKAPTKGKTPC
jgi:hypothetical protein